MAGLAFVDGKGGVATILDTRYEYLRTARATSDLPAALHGWIARIRFDGLPDNIPNANWPVHVAGHPPGALSFFVLLDRIGLGSGWCGRGRGHAARGLDRRGGAGHAASARRRGRRPPGRAVPGVRTGGDLAVRERGRHVRRRGGLGHRRTRGRRRAPQHRPVAGGRAAARLRGDDRPTACRCSACSRSRCSSGRGRGAPLVRGGGGSRRWCGVPRRRLLAWLDALPALHDRVLGRGARRTGHRRTGSWGNLAALAISAGPLVVGRVWPRGRRGPRRRPRQRHGRWRGGSPARPPAWWCSPTCPQMSQAEVERIWLPFVAVAAAGAARCCRTGLAAGRSSCSRPLARPGRAAPPLDGVVITRPRTQRCRRELRACPRRARPAR